MKTFPDSAEKCKSGNHWLFNYRLGIVLILFVYPYMVGFAPDSTGSSGTVIDLLIGTGTHSHVTYDCAGNVTSRTKYSSVDYGVAVSHNIKEFKFGGRAGGYSVSFGGTEGSSYYNYSTEKKGIVAYFNPFIGAENKYFDINFGASFFSRDYSYGNLYGHDNGNIGDFLIGNGDIHPTWSIRIGNREKFHFSTQYLSNVPILSGGGIADLGFGFGSTDSRNLTWVGTSFGPYEGFGLGLKQNVQLSRDIDLLLRGRAGSNEGTFEGAVSAGLRICLQ
jgi:hypothetical protein